MTVSPESIDYTHDDVACRGHLVVDRSTDAPRPGVVLFPDARGMSNTAIEAARRLAPHGYAVFVADLYGGAIFHADIPEAHRLMTALRSDVDRWRARAEAALDVVAGLPVVDASKIAAIGYCFGGTTALELGRSGA
ncbi:MAG TPA: dienelactone hydrolase family protein, partial [Reyranella sp.]|nr:dienelactone hydrolase family protein [Reyranella sp.]